MPRFPDAETCVFWDTVECPSSIAVYNVTRALRSASYNGKVSFKAYCDITKFKDEYDLPGVMSACHLPAGDKNERLDRILVDIMFWAIATPEGTNYVLICGDISGRSDFNRAFSRLYLLRYYCILVQHQYQPSDEFPFVERKWLCNQILDGGDRPIAEPCISKNSSVSSSQEEGFTLVQKHSKSLQRSKAQQDKIGGKVLSSEQEDKERYGTATTRKSRETTAGCKELITANRFSILRSTDED